jgi:hypothetical protein
MTISMYCAFASLFVTFIPIQTATALSDSRITLLVEICSAYLHNADSNRNYLCYPRYD